MKVLRASMLMTALLSGPAFAQSPHINLLVDGPGDLTADWLTRAVGADVAQVIVTPIGTGQTGASYRLDVTYAAPAELRATGRWH